MIAQINNEAVDLANRGRDEDAEQLFRDAATRFPGLEIVEKNWAQLLCRQGRWEEATGHYQKVLSLAESPE